MSRWQSVVRCLLVLALLLLPLVGEAEEAVRIVSTSAETHFPEEILFHVVAESGTAEIVTLALSYRVSGSPYTRSRWPEFSPDRRVEATFRLDTQREHYMPGTVFHYYWTAEDAAGRVTESEEQSFVYRDDRFDWQENSTERVAVHWYEGGADFGRRLLDTAVRALDRLEQDAGVEADRKIEIYIYARDRDFRAALGPNAPEWIGGLALPQLALIVAYIDPSAQVDGEIGRIVPHELSHVVLYQATHNPYAANPNWLEEGIAVHNQEVADADFPAIVDQAARDGRLIPLRALAAPFPSDTDLALLSYAESLSVVEFILYRYGEEGLSALVDVFSEGETSGVAVQRALGITLDELEAAWRATLPAAERTPLPGATARPLRGEGGLQIDRGIRVFASALACTFCLSVGVVVAVVVILVRRRQRYGEEEGVPPVERTGS